LVNGSSIEEANVLGSADCEECQQSKRWSSVEACLQAS
jgi:hypothetical protein